MSLLVTLGCSRLRAVAGAEILVGDSSGHKQEACAANSPAPDRKVRSAEISHAQKPDPDKDHHNDPIGDLAALAHSISLAQSGCNEVYR